MDSNYEILESLIAWIAGDESGGGDVERYLASPRVAALARVLDVAGPAPAKRQALAGNQPLQLRGRPQALQPRTARLVAALSDELRLDEEACLELFAKVTDRARRRELAERLGLARGGALDDDVAGAARRLWYFEARCGLRALGELVKGALDGRLPRAKKRVLGDAAVACLRADVPATLLAGVKALSGSAWAQPAERAAVAGALAASVAETCFFAFYEVQILDTEAARLFEAARDLSAALDDAGRKAGTPSLHPHAAKLRRCRDVLLLAAVQALDGSARFRDRGAAAPSSSTALFLYGDAADGDDAVTEPNALRADAGAAQRFVDAWPAPDGLEGRGARGVAALAVALLKRPRSWDAADPASEQELRRRLTDALDAGVCQFLVRTHGLLRGALRDGGGGREPVVYLVALGELASAFVEALLDVDALPGPRGDVEGPQDGLEDVLALVVGVGERLPSFTEKFFGAGDATALGHLVRRVGDCARHDDLGRVPYLTLLGAVARGSPQTADAVRDFLRAGDQPDGEFIASSGVFDGSAPPPGYSLKNFLALVDRYGEMLRANELERSGATQPPPGAMQNLYRPFDAPREPLWLSVADADALVAVADVLANCARPSPAHVERLCDACASSSRGGDAPGHRDAARVAGSLLRLYARESDAVPPDLKAALLRAVVALCACPKTAEVVAKLVVAARVVESKGVVFSKPPRLLKLPRAMLAQEAPPPPPPPAPPSPYGAAFGQVAAAAAPPAAAAPAPVSAAVALSQPGAVNPLVQQLDECCGEGEGVADRDLRGAETRLRTYGATGAVLALLAAVEPHLDGAARVAAVKFAARDVLLRCAVCAEAAPLAFRFDDERWRLATRALALCSAVLGRYAPGSPDWADDFDAASRSPSPSGGFAVLYDALGPACGLLRAVAGLAARAREAGGADDGLADDFGGDDDDLCRDDAVPPPVGAVQPGGRRADVDDRSKLRHALDVRAVKRARAAALAGAGAAWWRSRCEAAALELLGAVAEREAAFGAACRDAAAGRSPASRALVDAAAAPPRTLGELLLSSAGAHQAAPRELPKAFEAMQTSPGPDGLPHPSFALATAGEKPGGLRGFRDDDLASVRYFGCEPQGLLSELAARVAPRGARHAEATSCRAVFLLSHVAATSTDGARFLAALAASERGRELRDAFAARVAAPLEGDGDDDAAWGATTPDADGLADPAPPAAAAWADARFGALELLAAPETRDLAGWLLNGGALSAVVDLALACTAPLDKGPRLAAKACETGERALGLLFVLAKRRTSRSMVVDAVTAGDDGRALTTLVARAAAAVAGDAVPAASARLARALLDVVAVCAHASKLPEGVAERSRGRCRGAVDAYFGAAPSILGAPFRVAAPEAARLDDVFDRDPSLRKLALAHAAKPTSRLYAVLDVVDAAGLDAAARKALPADVADRLGAWAAHANEAAAAERAALDLADAAQRLGVVAAGFAYEAAVVETTRDADLGPVPYLTAGGDPFGDAAPAGLDAPRRALVALVEAAAAALQTCPRGDGAAAEPLARGLADGLANLRSLGEVADLDASKHVSEFAALVAAVGASLERRRDATTEVFRGHCYVALAHGLAALRRGGAAGAVSHATWSRVCVDAAASSTPWARLAASAALAEGAPQFARDAAERSDGPPALSADAVASAFASLEDGGRDAALDASTLETAAAALLRLGAARQDVALRLVDGGVVEALARCGAFRVVAGAAGDARARGTVLSLELLRALLARLPEHAALRGQARAVATFDAASSASLAARYLDARRPPDALGSLRARSALVAILAALARPTVDEDYVSGKRRTDDDDYCAGLCWHLVSATAAEAPAPGLGEAAAARRARALDRSERSWRAPAPDLADPAWWARVAPATARERRQADARSRPPGGGATAWSAFDDRKLAAAATLWARCVDFARVALRARPDDPRADAGALARHVAAAAAVLDAGLGAGGPLAAAAGLVLDGALAALKDALAAPGAKAAEAAGPALRDAFLSYDALAEPEPDSLTARLKRHVADAVRDD